jgi:phage regulator Rha-like protein
MSDKSNKIVPVIVIQNRIFTIRTLQIMIDRDLADLYGVETKVLNQAVKRNIERFPESFRFQLTEEEGENLRSQIAISNDSLRSQIVTLKSQRGKHRKYLPYAFTEQGVAMLSAVLRSETAVRVSIQIMQAFVDMRKFLLGNAQVFQRLDRIETRQLQYQNETEKNFEQVFDALQSKDLKPKQGIFYDGQIFDAYTLVADIIRSAEKSIILIDNYIDDSVLKLFTKRKSGVTTVIYTQKISAVLTQDLKKHNSQYEPITAKKLKKSHDRFLIIDGITVYHIGASLKDLGNKWFAFSKIEIDAKEMIGKL